MRQLAKTANVLLQGMARDGSDSNKQIYSRQATVFDYDLPLHVQCNAQLVFEQSGLIV
jgi:hypothetical protein